MNLDFAVWQGDSLFLVVHAQPGARHSGFAGLHDGALKIRLKAPALEGRANQELCRFLADVFGVPVKQVELLQGAASRHKRVRIKAPQCVPEELVAMLPQPS